MGKRKHAAEPDPDAWADVHEGNCLSGSIHELREANPPGKPFEPVRGTLGFLEYVGDSLKAPTIGKRRKRK